VYSESAMSTPAWVGMGSNLGDRRAHLDRAAIEIGRLPRARVTAVSHWIETAPVGGPPDQPQFINGALALEFAGSARELLDGLQSIERAHGRDRSREVRHGPRTLDLDLLMFGEQAIDEPGLCLPHPGLEDRVFVLAPLAEIAPDLWLPRSGITVGERVAELVARDPRARRSAQE